MSAHAAVVPVCAGCDGEQTDVFEVQGLDCANEVNVIEGRLRALPGVCSVRASAMTGCATVVHTRGSAQIVGALADMGFRARRKQREGGVRRTPLAGIVLAASLAVAGLAAQGLVNETLAVVFFLPGILIGGAPIAIKGLARARHGQLEMNTLMTVAVLGAMVIGEWAEGVATVVLFSLAQILEERSMERARRALSSVMSLAPEEAVVRGPGGDRCVPVAELQRGDVVLVKPGERLPVDGVITVGRGELDLAPLTGESMPVEREPGDEVYAGTINGHVALTMRVARPASESTLARIVRRVEEAQASRAPTQSFVDRFARVYTPAVVGLAVLLAAVPPLMGLGDPGEWLHRALVLLVIACPCALVISTPVAIVSALTAASRRGVLIKGGAHLETMGVVRAVLFDKTGTLTRGEPEVSEVVPAAGRSEDEVLALAAALELLNTHPLGQAVIKAARQREVSIPAAHDVRVLPGQGVRGRITGSEVSVGSHRLFTEEGLCDHSLDEHLERLESAGHTTLLVAADGGLVGVMAVSDGVRTEAQAALRALDADGIASIMLTGDNRLTAAALAKTLGISEWQAELMPEDKVAAVRDARQRFGPVAVAGDGVNDAPALATANVGIAMGGRGTDVALETADIVLMSDDLRRIAETVRLGRAALRTVRWNIAMALGVKAAVLALALAGLGSLWAAVAADMGASLLVIGTGMRLLRWSP